MVFFSSLTYLTDRETQQNVNTTGTFHLNSDLNFSKDPSTVKDYNRFVGNQDNWYVYLCLLCIR